MSRQKIRKKRKSFPIKCYLFNSSVPLVTLLAYTGAQACCTAYTSRLVSPVLGFTASGSPPHHRQLSQLPIVTCRRKLYLKISFKKLNQLHAVSRTQTGRQREPSVTDQKTLPTFLRIREVLRVGFGNSTPRFASTTELRNENIHLNKYFISSNGNRTHHLSILQSHFEPYKHPNQSQIKIKNQTDVWKDA